ncbi:MAG: hypothetical protein ABSF35_20690 [Polyangia bacterium]|jgi:hypothetical protein
MKLWHGALEVVALLVLGCGGTTGGHLISMPLHAGGIARDVSQPFAFTTSQGWTVELDQAEVVLGPLYFNIDPPEPSVFRSGVVIVQATEQFVVDVLNPALQDVPGGADGETGHAVSVEIGFYTTAESYNDTITLPAPLAADGQQGTAYVAGEATKSGTVVDFAGRVQITNALVSGLNPIDDVSRVAGAVCDLTFTTTSGPLQLRVDPSHWFDQADFCSLVATSVDDVSDGGASDGGASDGGDGSVDTDTNAPASGPCAPTRGTVYAWTDTNPFNTEALAGLGGSVGVYDFTLGQ